LSRPRWTSRRQRVCCACASWFHGYVALVLHPHYIYAAWMRMIPSLPVVNLERGIKLNCQISATSWEDGKWRSSVSRLLLFLAGGIYYFPSKMLGAKSPTYLLLSSYRSCFDSRDGYFTVHNVEYLVGPCPFTWRCVGSPTSA
jgi:hypothetical protein